MRALFFVALVLSLVVVSAAPPPRGTKTASASLEPNHHLRGKIRDVVDLKARFFYQYVQNEGKATKRYWLVAFYTAWCQIDQTDSQSTFDFVFGKQEKNASANQHNKEAAPCISRKDSFTSRFEISGRRCSLAVPLRVAAGRVPWRQR